jgi:mono/diheme cytochrome c family protein
MWITRSRARAVALAGVVAGAIALREAERADAQSGAPAPARPAPSSPAHAHGTPKGWRFAWPKGDPGKGRGVFQKLECYSCHEVRGERFPAPTDSVRAGPELAGMAQLHPPEYFAESIINPGAVIERGRGYAAADGSSKMPSYADSLTVQEAVDLVAYLRQLRLPAAPVAPARGPGGHGGHKTP